MYTWLRMMGFLSIVAIVFTGPSAFAGEQESLPESPGGVCGDKDTRFFQRDLIVWGVVAEGGSKRELTSAPEIQGNISSLNAHEAMFWEDGPTDNRSDGEGKNRSVYLKSLNASQVEASDPVESVDLGIVFGVNYAFKRFRLNHFYNAILFFISDDGEPRKENAVAFYVDIP